MKAEAPTREGSTLSALARAGRTLLSQGGITNAELESTWILESALGCSRQALWLQGEDSVPEARWEAAMALLVRRANREPLQYVLGSQEFCGLDFEVGPAVLIPRPETALLVAETVRHCRSFPRPMIADIGTGSGCIAVALARAMPEALVVATDLSPTALDVARRNVRRHGVEDRVRLLEGDLCGPLEGAGLDGQLAAVISNPPYITDSELGDLQPEVRCFEPLLALAGGVDGLVVHRRLVHAAAPLLKPGGLVVLEVGLGQAERLKVSASPLTAYDRIWVKRDDAGVERAVCLRRRRSSP